MSVFLDASAIVAIIAREPEADTFAARIDWETNRLTSALAIWEAARSLPNARGADFAEARELVAALVKAADLAIVPVGEVELALALDTHAKYGRGVSPANLNFGDCFSYACAKRHGAALLFKGEDFIQTDISDATLE